ncbi:hypothetical protein SMC26_31830 [Actinomadura fulvescens]|uniref:Chromosome partitioning protein ParB n=1 Tax=Actinomadura fulvescens TaxID=46160 RepID=A0ABN3Q7X5_9ACTN
MTSRTARSRFADRPEEIAPQSLSDLLSAEEPQNGAPGGTGGRRGRKRPAMTLRRVT